MRLKYNIEMVDMGDETIGVPIGEGAQEIHGVLKLNKEGLEIINLLNEKTDEESIVSYLLTKYENDRKTLEKYVRDTIKTLRKEGLVED